MSVHAWYVSEPCWLSGGPDSGNAPLGLIWANMVAKAFRVEIRSLVETNWVGTAIPISPTGVQFSTSFWFEDLTANRAKQLCKIRVSCREWRGQVLFALPITFGTIYNDRSCYAKNSIIRPSCGWKMVKINLSCKCANDKPTHSPHVQKVLVVPYSTGLYWSERYSRRCTRLK